MNHIAKRVLSTVGTRKATVYGRDLIDKIVKGLSHLDDLLIISGLAYGIDVAAHKFCLKYGVPTVGVLAHGLDRIYPPYIIRFQMLCKNMGFWCEISLVERILIVKIPPKEIESLQV